MFNALRYFRDRRIDYATDGPKCSQGWVNIHCPFCRSRDKHLGYNLTEGYFHCWHGCRIGSVENLVMTLEQIPYHDACKIVMEYDDDFEYSFNQSKKRTQGLSGKIEWPLGTAPMQTYHKTYLKNRKYDPDYLEYKYQLLGTIQAGSYASRIMAPIFFEGQWVSYQGRDITGKALLKYKACKKELELIDHKKILYNLDNCQKNKVIVVEGLFDVWRLGDDSCATFGTSVTNQQIYLLTKFKRVFILFDSEPEAQSKAQQLANQLAIFGLEAVNIRLFKGDPGEMQQEDANKMKNELL